MNARSVVIVPPFMRGDGSHTAMLRSAGFEVRVPPEGTDVTRPDGLVAALGDAEAAIAGSEPYTREVIAGARRLRVIARVGVGYDSIDLRAADERGIAVTTTPGVNQDAVAEHALAMLLALARGFPRRDLMVRRGDPWRKAPMPRIAGRTLGLLGLGRTGRALAARASGLQLELLAYDPRPDREFADRHGIELASFAEVLRRSDFVSLHLPLTDATRGLIDARALAQMKRGAILVNTARGGVVAEKDLHAALVAGHLAGAGLDVFESEPVSADHPLLQLDNVLLSPHVGGLDAESQAAAQTMVAQILVDLAAGRWPSDCVVNLRGVTGWRW